MSRTAIALGALVLAIASASAGYRAGVEQGTQAEAGRRDGKALDDLKELINSNMVLIAKAGQASRAMRQVIAQRASADVQTTKELKDALARTADSRAGCVFPADVMRGLDAARDRAAQAAAGGVRGALSAASGSAPADR